MGAWNPQESGRKAPLSCNAVFSMLQCSVSLAAAQLLVQMTSALQKSRCCSAVSAAQQSENCSATSVLACAMLQAWGLERWGLGLAESGKGTPSHGPKVPKECAPESQNSPKRWVLDSFSEDAMGGWKKEGGGKPHEWHPSQKGVLDPPSYGTFSTPLRCQCSVFLYKNPRQSRPEALLEGSKNFRGSAFSGTFSSPHTFCTPPYHGPTFWTLLRLRGALFGDFWGPGRGYSFRTLPGFRAPRARGTLCGAGPIATCEANAHNMRNHPQPQRRAWTTEVECQTPARSTSPDSCSTGSALWEFFRKSAVLQGKRPWRTGETVAKIQILPFLPWG